MSDKPLKVALYALTRMPDDEKQRGALLIAASLIAAIRLRGEPIQPSPQVEGHD